jgi:hypothetical protein
MQRWLKPRNSHLSGQYWQHFSVPGIGALKVMGWCDQFFKYFCPLIVLLFSRPSLHGQMHDLIVRKLFQRVILSKYLERFTVPSANFFFDLNEVYCGICRPGANFNFILCLILTPCSAICKLFFCSFVWLVWLSRIKITVLIGNLK